MIFRIAGMDRDSGEEKVVVIEAACEQDALDEVFERNLVVEKIEPVKEAKPKRSRPVIVSGDETPPYEGENDLHPESSQHPPKRRNVSWLRITEYSWRSAYNRQVSIIAMGVMIGMFLFSCISAGLMALISNWLTQPKW